MLLAPKLLLSLPVLCRDLGSLLPASPELITGPPIVLLSLLLLLGFAIESLEDSGTAVVDDSTKSPESFVLGTRLLPSLALTFVLKSLLSKLETFRAAGFSSRVKRSS